MDLGKIDCDLWEFESFYIIFGDVKVDFGLIFMNMFVFNGLIYDVIVVVLNVVKMIWNEVKIIFEEEFVKFKFFFKVKLICELCVVVILGLEVSRRQFVGLVVVVLSI